MNSLIQFNKIQTVKKVMLALVIAAVLNVPAAQAILIPLPGNGLQSGYTLRIQGGSGDSAVMLEAVVRSRLEVEETLTVPAGTTVDLLVTIPSRASRVILVLDPAMIGFDPTQFSDVTVTILDQNLNPVIPSLIFTTDPHIELAFEVAP